MASSLASTDPSSTPLLSDVAGGRDAHYGTGPEPPADAAPTDRSTTTTTTTTTTPFARNLGALDAFAIIISIVIGSGIFTSPGSIDTNVPSPGVALVVWLVGGILAWTGASTMTELGTAIPGEGGVQPYLKYIYGDVWGHLAAWTWVVAIMPATLAILSIVFVESIFSAAGVTDQAASLSHKLLSVLIMAVMNLANSISTRASTRLNNFFVGTKFLSIFGVVLAGIVVLFLHLAHPDDNNSVGGGDWHKRNWFADRDTVITPGDKGGLVIHWQDVSTWELLGHLSAALYGALWAYSGWEKGIYVSAELSNPVKQLPLAINTAIPTIVLCFLAANAAYYILLPWDVVSTTDSVAVTAIARLLGRGFGIVAAVLICLVVAGSLLGNSFVAGRMAVAAANANWLPSLFAAVGKIGPAGSTEQEEEAQDHTDKSGSDAPLNAILLNTLLSALFIFLGDFRSLVTFNGLGEYTFFFLTVLGAVVLRFREPQLRRPYKPLLLVPVVFTLVSGFVLVRGAVFAPAQALVLLVCEPGRG
ncbi:amino acid transporter [Cryphonectria parasitica EP155]|uniref:Amino acid transporter n=1 Tax=Cryphonectria parasitica (strain ATCC 38755 / EP155) TaxID=660469 RepID=A0A9P5CWV6_CRYP1|nr:amino acid transporter [Cryphonectria parasitica EP155]KAF3771305.1 amino acid transporter [Cryphonectria parasitica EP155]